MICKFGPIEISPQIYLAAKSVQDEDHEITPPKSLEENTSYDVSEIWKQDFKRRLSNFICENHNNFDSVLFSCPMGTKPDVDFLDKNNDNVAVLTPIILPDEPVKLSVKEQIEGINGAFGTHSVALSVGRCYLFNQIEQYWLEVTKKPSHCVFIISSLKEQ